MFSFSDIWEDVTFDTDELQRKSGETFLERKYEISSFAIFLKRYVSLFQEKQNAYILGVFKKCNPLAVTGFKVAMLSWGKMLHRILYLGEMVWCRIYGPRVFGVFQCKMICLKIAPKHLNTTVPLSDHTKFSSPLPVWFFSADDLIFLEFHLVHAFLHSD